MAKRKKIPMALAGCHVYKGQKLDWRYAYAEKKMDGYRGVLIFNSEGKGKAYTHNGCEVHNASHIIKAMEHSKLFRACVLDGEFLCQGNWNDTGSVVMTQTKHVDAKRLSFNAFDYIHYAVWLIQADTPILYFRKQDLYELIRKYKNKNIVTFDYLNFVKHKKLKATPSAIERFMKKQVKRGHEGCVIKNPDSLYAFKKSSDWLKVKPSYPVDLKIVGVTAGKNRFAKLKWLGALILKGKVDGKTVSVKCSGMTDEQREQFTKMHKKGKLVGLVAEIKHEGITVNNAVRFPRFNRLRLDK